MDKHDVVSALKNLAIDLGRTPTRSEFCANIKGGEYKITKHFGTYTAMVQAAGLDTYDERRAGKKIDNSIFEKKIEEHLTEHFAKPREEGEARYPRIASISDIHWPFVNQRVVDKFLAYIEVFQPEYIVINGDAWDMYSHSKYPRSHNVFTPRDEQALARKQNEDFWKDVKKRCPNAQCFQLLGNHDIRPLKRVLESYPEAEDWIADKMKELFTFDGVTTIFDVRQELLIGNIAIFHGYRSQLGAHRDYTLLCCINGHTHKGGVVFRKIRGQVIWELNSGLAGDPEAKGLTYTPQRLSDWTPGFAVVDEFGPRFMPA